MAADTGADSSVGVGTGTGAGVVAEAAVEAEGVGALDDAAAVLSTPLVGAFVNESVAASSTSLAYWCHWVS